MYVLDHVVSLLSRRERVIDIGATPVPARSHAVNLTLTHDFSVFSILPIPQVFASAASDQTERVIAQTFAVVDTCITEHFPLISHIPAEVVNCLMALAANEKADTQIALMVSTAFASDHCLFAPCALPCAFFETFLYTERFHTEIPLLVSGVQYKLYSVFRHHCSHSVSSGSCCFDSQYLSWQHVDQKACTCLLNPRVVVHRISRVFLLSLPQAMQHLEKVCAFLTENRASPSPPVSPGGSPGERTTHSSSRFLLFALVLNRSMIVARTSSILC